MRAARLHELGGIPRLDEIDPPEGAGLVRVSASSLNPVDVSIGNGRFYGGSPPTPYVIGSEVAGTTEDGRRVWVRGRELMAELVDPEAGWVFEIPDGVSDGLALACGIAGLTAWLAVAWRVPVGARRHRARPGRERGSLGVNGRAGGEGARREARDRRGAADRPDSGGGRRGLRPRKRRRAARGHADRRRPLG